MSTKQIRIIILSLASVVVVVGLLLYFFKAVYPAGKEVAELRLKLSNETKMLEALQKQVGLKQQNPIDTLELQRKVPIEPFIDALILDMRQVEKETKTTFENIGISYSETTLADLPVLAEAATELDSDNNEESLEEETPAADAAPIQVNTLTMGLVVNAPDYKSLKEMIVSLEQLDRIVKVDSLSVTEAADTYTLTITVYYAPQFAGLTEQLPKAKFPPPSGKLVPFSTAKPIIETPITEEGE